MVFLVALSSLPRGASAASPLVYWKFDDGSGSTAADSSGNGYTATLRNMSTTGNATSGWQSPSNCKSGSCLRFDGVNDYISAASIPLNITAGNYNTVSFWMYWNGKTNQIPINIGNTYDFWIEAASCMGFNTGAGDSYGMTDLSAINTKWAYVTLVFFNGNYTGNNKIYINGVDQPLAQCDGTSHSGTAGSTVYMGRLGASYYFNGTIDEVKIYNSVLSAAEVLADYQSMSTTTTTIVTTTTTTTLPSGTIAYWKLDDGSGYATAADSSGSGNTGTLTNMNIAGNSTSGWATGANCKSGSCLRFDGVNDYMDCGKSAILNLSSGAFTIAFWVNGGFNSEVYTAIMDKSNSSDWTGGTAAKLGFWLAYTGLGDSAPGNNLVFDISDGRDTGYDSISLGDMRNTGWTYVAITVDDGAATSPQIKGYKNGALVTSTTRTRTSSINTATNLNIGQWRAYSRNFNGTLDEVKIFGRALTAAEVLADYQSIPTTTTTTTSTTTTTTIAPSTTTTTMPQAMRFTSFSFLTKTNQLNVNWVTEYSGGISVSVKCTLNDAQNCNPFPYTGPAGGGGCTINAPAYNTAPASGGSRTVANKLNCTAYDTAQPSTKYENIINFYPRSLEVSVPSTMNPTLGEQENLLITIKNNGTLTDTYSVSVTPTNPNLVMVTDGSQTTESLNNNDVQQIYAKLTLLVSRQSTTVNVVVSSVSQPSIQFSVPVSVRGTDKSLPEFDAYGLVQLVLLAAVLASFLF
ncbi:MAG: LamG domain-containing protein [Candidatus Aenigmarchaeota archaeon]|nr:LamG domain-containing protein [Candidatus Aenigmarchaeota archaeon]